MIDAHSFAIFCRGIKNGDNRYLSIGLSCTWKQALDVTDIIGTEIGYTDQTTCRYYKERATIHVNYHLTGQGTPGGQQSYITLTIDHGTESLAKQLDRIINNSLCLRCKTYLGRDCHDHGVVAHCVECAEYLDIGEPASGGRSYFDDGLIEIELI